MSDVSYSNMTAEALADMPFAMEDDMSGAPGGADELKVGTYPNLDMLLLDSSDAQDVDSLYRLQMQKLWVAIAPHLKEVNYNIILRRILLIDEWMIEDVSDVIETVPRPPRSCYISFGKNRVALECSDLLFHVVDNHRRLSGEAEMSVGYSMARYGIAMAMQEVKNMARTGETHAHEARQQKIDRYLAYRKALETANGDRASAVSFLRKASDEIKLRIFDELAHVMLPRRQQFETGDSLYNAVITVLKPLGNVKLQGPPDLSNKRRITTLKALDALFGMNGKDMPERTFLRDRPARTDDDLGIKFTNLEDLWKAFGTADEAIVKYSIIHTRSNFPMPRRPDRLPYPAALADHTRYILSLTLYITLDDFMHTCYPNDLFLAQDNIPKLKYWLPNLVTFKLEIVNYARHNKTYSLGPYLARREEGGFTMLQSELGKIIAGMRKLDVEEAVMRYYGGSAAGKWMDEKNGKDGTEPERVDARGVADEEEIIGQIMDPTCRFEVLV